MGFTTLKTIYLPVEKNNKKQCKTSHMLLIMDVTKLNEKRNIYFLKWIFPLKPSVGK